MTAVEAAAVRSARRTILTSRTPVRPDADAPAGALTATGREAVRRAHRGPVTTAISAPHDGPPRQGPGSDATTRRLPAPPRRGSP